MVKVKLVIKKYKKVLVEQIIEAECYMCQGKYSRDLRMSLVDISEYSPQPTKYLCTDCWNYTRITIQGTRMRLSGKYKKKKAIDNANHHMIDQADSNG